MNSDTDLIIIDEEIGDEQEEQQDAFLGFVDYAKSLLSIEDRNDLGEIVENEIGPSWNWIVSRILKTCSAYSSGVTAAILLSDLSQAWNEQYRAGAPKRRPECITQLKRNHRRTKLPNTVTIDSIYEKNYLSVNSILEAVIVEVFVLPGTNIYMLRLGDFWSSSTIDLYLHRRYYDLVDLECPDRGILKKGREIFLTGCNLRTTRGSGYPRLLPTEYVVILLDENEDDDAILLGAQFCTDSFSSISLNAVRDGTSFSFYARIQSIGLLENYGRDGTLKRKQVTLVDNDDLKLSLFLWGEQVLLANLFSVGSMLALDRPFIASAAESNIETAEEFCLEYGTATQLYLVPFNQHEEQISVASTQNRPQGSRTQNGFTGSQGHKVSQVTLPRDSQGSVDFSNYPFRSFVMDLSDKMTSINLYGVVIDIFQDRSTSEKVFVLKIGDVTGEAVVKLHFINSWSLGRLSFGHTVHITGLACYKSSQNLLEMSWFEKDVGASLVNLSCLPALLNSPCLHKMSYLSDLSIQTNITHICNVHVEDYDVNSRLSHVVCGHFVTERSDGFLECSFCHYESMKISAWCTGQTAAELLQVSPDEFYELNEDDQAMYLYTLENERFTVAIVNCKRQIYGDTVGLNREVDSCTWEIARALKCE
ncbi:hypothetical protein AQUCO_00300529v1 [Aquilegia coerulea]|uniref:Uncharacterized protein n=1 Tax=Aquilegia coerulea TaxID=218851 RepID=A0A2G5EZC6_AQUCA|nr:hypothetical protein AQUCO_00300529v1 [Aquilegia coerulea]